MKIKTGSTRCGEKKNIKLLYNEIKKKFRKKNSESKNKRPHILTEDLNSRLPKIRCTI